MRTLNLRTSRYKWLGKQATRELQPGVAYQAIRFQDYDCESYSFTNNVYAAANTLGLKATCAVFESSVVFAFYHPDAFLRPNLAAYPVVKKIRGSL